MSGGPGNRKPTVERPKVREQVVKVKRSGYVWLTLFVLFMNSCWAVYHLQFESLPLPVGPDEAGKRGFSEVSALEHVQYLASLGPHPVGSEALEKGVQYVFAVAEKIKSTAHWEVDVQVDLFHAETGANRLTGGLFKGKTLIYSDLKHVVLRILPKYLPEAEDNSILVSSHIDTVFSAEGAGDCSSCVGVMLELARGVSQWAHGFKNGVIFLFNTGEEEGLNGAHSFITQHPWKNTIRFAIDLEAMGIGGKSSIFQGGSVPWPIETYANVAKYPSGQILAQDLFHSGLISSATDFQVYQEVGGLSGLDFAYADASAVYHTKNDKLKLLKPGSLQHLGENMLELLIHSASSPNLQKEMEVKKEEGTGQNNAIFFDILGTYMVTFSRNLATMLYNSVILQSLLIWVTSLLMGGSRGAILFGLSCLSIILMWICSLSLSVVVALIIPVISSSPVPYVANPWLVIGLFGAPAVMGAITGQHFAFQIITRYLKLAFSKTVTQLPTSIQGNIIKLEAERWLFKAGFIQWLLVLIVGHYYKVGSSYVALAWLVSPAFAYGLMEATLSPARLPKQLKIVTLIVGLALPVLISSGMVMRLVATLIGIIVRSERNPGDRPEWIGSTVVAVLVATFVCLMLVYLLSYIHLSGAKVPFIFALCTLFALSLAAVSTGILPAFTEDVSRAVNVVHVVETSGNFEQKPSSFISLFSNTPGKLADEVKDLKDEDFICDSNRTVDFVTFNVKYGCHSIKGSEIGWSKSDIPTVHVESDSTKAGVRTTQVLVDTKIAKRWSLAINGQEIRDFTFEVDGEEIVPLGDKSYTDGWHIIQFSGGSNSPSRIHLNLVWLEKPAPTPPDGSSFLLKLRADVNKVTPKVERVINKLPSWCSLFGKSTSPFTLAFLTTLPVQF